MSSPGPFEEHLPDPDPASDPPDPADPAGDPADPVGEPQQWRRLSPLTPLIRAPIIVAAFLAGSWQQVLGEGLLRGLLIVSAVVLVGGIFGLASWLRTKYWIDGDELRIDKGVISRQSRRIRIDRLQGIDIVQPLLARIFGLAELRFDVASGSEKEGALAFLPHRDAVELRRVLLARRGSSAAAAAAQGADGQPQPVKPSRVLFKLDLGVLLASVALSPSTVVFFLVGVVMVASSILTGTPLVVGGAVPVLIGLSFAAVRSLNGFYGFTLSDTEEGLHVRRGLTALSSQTVPLHRVQGVLVTEPVMWRPFGWARLDVSVAGSAGSADNIVSASTVLPVGDRDQVLRLARLLLGERDPTAVALYDPPTRARWLAPLSGWTLAFGQDRHFAVSRRGFFVRRFDVVPHEKVQSVRVTQGPLQRALDLATVHLDSPTGGVSVRADLRSVADSRRQLVAAVDLSRATRHAAAERQADPQV